MTDLVATSDGDVASRTIGDDAGGTTDSGSAPVKIGGLASSTTPSATTTGKRVDGWANVNGAFVVSFGGTGSADAASTPSLPLDAAGASRPLGVVPYSWNGTNADRQRGNLDNVSLIAASGVTTTQTGADQTNYNARGLHVVLDMTTVGTGSVTLEIDGKDPVSGKYYAILTGAAVTTNSTNVYKVYPGITAAANVSASDILPRTWRVKVTANNANATTYTVAAMLVV